MVEKCLGLRSQIKQTWKNYEKLCRLLASKQQKLVSMKSLSCDAVAQRSKQTYSRLILSKDSRVKFLKLEPIGISPFKAAYDNLNQAELLQQFLFTAQTNKQF